MKLMLDANVVLDFIQHREPHYAYSALVIQEVVKQRVTGVLSLHVLTTMYYILAKQLGRTRANQDRTYAIPPSIPRERGEVRRRTHSLFPPLAGGERGVVRKSCRK